MSGLQIAVIALASIVAVESVVLAYAWAWVIEPLWEIHKIAQEDDPQGLIAGGAPTERRRYAHALGCWHLMTPRQRVQFRRFIEAGP